ncbi:MAG: LPS export ABC transporter periplasmic protein LptC [Gemmatimonadota bacterium]
MFTGKSLGALILGSLVLLPGCRGEELAPIVASELESMAADQVIFEMTHHFTREGVRQATVEADTAYFWEDSTFVALRNLELQVFDEDGRPRAEVTALRGNLDSRSDRMHAMGDVVLLVEGGARRIESQELFYDPRSARIWSDSATVLREGSQVVEGTAFESDEAFRNVRIRNARTRGGGIQF